MKNGEENISLDILNEAITKLINSNNADDFIKDSLGDYIPGCAALPSGAIISVPGPRKLIEKGELYPGQLLAFDCYRDNSSKREKGTFFTPLYIQPFPQFYIVEKKVVSKTETTIEFESGNDWEDAELWFSVLPWITNDIYKYGLVDNINSIANNFKTLATFLKFDLISGNNRIRLQPILNMDNEVPYTVSDNMIFPLNYVRSILAPFIFRLKIKSKFKLPRNDSISLSGKRFLIKVSVDRKLLDNFYKVIDISDNSIHGISVFGNVIPLINLQLENWDPKYTFKEFSDRSEYTPVGIAGVSLFKKHLQTMDQGASLEPIERHDVAFSIVLEEDRGIGIRYDIPFSEKNKGKPLLGVWMTLGDSINGLKLEYTHPPNVHPPYFTSNVFLRSKTVLTCIAGRSFNIDNNIKSSEYFLMRFAAPPQSLINKDTLVNKIRSMMILLGYERIIVNNPINEYRILKGKRKKVVVVPINDLGSYNISSNTLSAIEESINNYLPVGVDLVLELYRD